MTLRVNVPKNYMDEIEDGILKYLPSILVNSKHVGVRTDPEWHNNLTEEALQGKQELAISNNDNLISFERLYIHNKITPIVSRAFPEYRVRPSGFFHYPPTGYMGWHTNSDVPCKRLYITWASEAGKSFFRYKQDGVIHTDYDDEGLTFRLFNITDKPPYLWHCVGSETDRISIGYQLYDTCNGG